MLSTLVGVCLRRNSFSSRRSVDNNGIGCRLRRRGCLIGEQLRGAILRQRIGKSVHTETDNAKDRKRV